MSRLVSIHLHQVEPDKTDVGCIARYSEVDGIEIVDPGALTRGWSRIDKNNIRRMLLTLVDKMCSE